MSVNVTLLQLRFVPTLTDETSGCTSVYVCLATCLGGGFDKRLSVLTDVWYLSSFVSVHFSDFIALAGGSFYVKEDCFFLSVFQQCF